jgi:hypothetical protein
MASRKRKSKPTYSPFIEWPTEQLQLVPVTVERQTPPIGRSASWLVETYCGDKDVPLHLWSYCPQPPSS